MGLLDRRALMALMAGASVVFAAGAASAANLAEQMTLGNPKAKVEVIEYASAACPHCAHWDLEVFPAFKKKYIDTGKVHFVFREILTDPVQLAAAGFLLARCAGPGKYFSTLDGVFAAQKQWGAGGDIRASLVAVAKTAGLDEKQFDACLADPAALKALDARVEKFTTVDKVDATPTFIINGKRLEGAQPLEALDKAIAEAQAAHK